MKIDNVYKAKSLERLDLAEWQIRQNKIDTLGSTLYFALFNFMQAELKEAPEGKIRTFGYIWIYKRGNKKMATVKNIALITELLDKVSNLKEVEDMEIINIPDDVEADIGLKIKLKKGYDWLDVQHKINDIIWEIFEDKGELLAVYEEFEE